MRSDLIASHHDPRGVGTVELVRTSLDDQHLGRVGQDPIEPRSAGPLVPFRHGGERTAVGLRPNPPMIHT
ncbi:hypothetical protein [Dactylosporangium darangshiense]|uniref:hypothetical protein n=1 Tax=Dactylosporangium darangshiense TaxID=579108 RepID=UPI0031E7B995